MERSLAHPVPPLSHSVGPPGKTLDKDFVSMNNLSETLIRIGGIYNLGFVIFHLLFWRLFRWKEDLTSLTAINRSIIQILNLCLTFMFLLMAYISIIHATEMVLAPLGKTLSVAFALFWFLRMVEQVVFFGIKNRVSLLLTVAFLAGGIIYLLPVLIIG
jgi:hypothetical protein